MTATRSALEGLTHIRWRSAAEVSPAAKRLIDEHARLLGPVVRGIAARDRLPIAEAHGVALTPAHDTAEYAELYGFLAEAMDFTDSIVTWPIVLTIVAAELWPRDPDLGGLPNPWTPLVELYRLGYPASYDDAPDQSAVRLTVFLRGGGASFPTC